MKALKKKNSDNNLSTKSKILYSSGGMGFSIVTMIWISFMLYLYLPPEGSGMPKLISNGTSWFFLPTSMLIIVFGRLVEAVSNPIIGHLSDRSESELGRRRTFLIRGGLPLIMAVLLLFYPPAETVSTLNAVYMAVILGILLFFFTVYVIPWLALIPELTHTNRERSNLVTIQAAFIIGGIIIVMIAKYFIWDVLEGLGMGRAGALKLIVVILSITALILCYLGALPIDEERYSNSVPTRIKITESIRLTLKNQELLYYLFGIICFWFAINVIYQSSRYYIAVLLKRGEAFSSLIFGSALIVALIFLPIVNLLSHHIKKRTIMIIALVIFAISSGAIYFLGAEIVPIPITYQTIIIFGLMGIPISVLFVIPNAMLSDLAEYDGIKNRSKREAIHFAIQAFLMKINLGVSTLILFSLLFVFGNNLERPLGVRLTGPVVSIMCLIGIILFHRYPEEIVMDTLETHRKKSKAIQNRLFS